MDSFIFVKLLAAFAFIQFANSHEAYHDDSAPGCGVLNYEKVDSFPEEIDVKGIRLRILGQIQHGATSRVFHALHVDENGQKRCVAVKVVDMSRIEQHMQNQVTNEAQMLSELNEKKVDRIPLLFALENHPEKQTMSMVLELAHHDLFDEITPKMGRGKHGWVRRTFRQILGALGPVHENDIIHGDLKPENMAYFLTPQGQLELKVIDFGGAFRANTVNEACKQIVTGTVLYMSPEQVAWCSAHGEQEFDERQREFPLSRKSDVWSIGIILYQMLFGRNPYHWVMQKYEGLEEPERTDKGDKELRMVIFDGEKPIEFGEYEDGPMLEMLKRCLDRNPEKRPEVPELMTELDKLGKLKGKLAKLEEQMDEYEKELKEMEGKIEGEKGLQEEEDEEEDEKKEENEKKEEEKKMKEEEEEEEKMKEEEKLEEKKKMKEDEEDEDEKKEEEKTKEDEKESEEEKEKMKEQIREIEEQIEKKKQEEVKNKFEKILGIGKKVENVDKAEKKAEEMKTLAKNGDEPADKDEKAEEIVKVAIGDKNPAFIFHVKNIRRAVPASMK